MLGIYLAFLSLCIGQGEAATQLTLRGVDTLQSEIEITPGDVLTLELFIDVENTLVNGISAMIQYDSDYIEVRDADTKKTGVQPCHPGPFLPGLILQNEVRTGNTGKPSILYSIGAIGSVASGNGVVSEITFDILAPIDTTKISVALGNPPQTLYSVAEGGARTEEFAELGSAVVHILGSPGWDTNRDNVIDISDLVLVGLHFGERPVLEPSADVNEDGSVDILDMVAIGRHFGERYRN